MVIHPVKKLKKNQNRLKRVSEYIDDCDAATPLIWCTVDQNWISFSVKYLLHWDMSVRISASFIIKGTAAVELLIIFSSLCGKNLLFVFGFQV